MSITTIARLLLLSTSTRVAGREGEKEGGREGEQGHDCDMILVLSLTLLQEDHSCLEVHHRLSVLCRSWHPDHS